MKTGETIGSRFELRQVLGEGGMGQVFKAWDTDLERFVAVKTLLPQLMSDPSAFQEMKQEVRISQRLSHPCIVAVYDYRVHERTPYIIMEFVEGVPLHHYLYRQAGRKLDEQQFMVFADLILSGVGYAHERGVVHRDLKPANIMVLANTGVKLMDFGIAAAIKATYTRVTGHTSGLTIQYSSPEQINGDNPHPSMDIYSLGCVFYEMLTGHPPFYQGEVLHQHLTRQPSPMPGVSPNINSAVLASLVKDPQKRLRTVAEIRGALAGDRTVRVPKSRTAPPGRPGAPAPRVPPTGDLPGGPASAGRTAQPPATGPLDAVRSFCEQAAARLGHGSGLVALAGGCGILILIVILVALARPRPPAVPLAPGGPAASAPGPGEPSGSSPRPRPAEPPPGAAGRPAPAAQPAAAAASLEPAPVLDTVNPAQIDALKNQILADVSEGNVEGAVSKFQKLQNQSKADPRLRAQVQSFGASQASQWVDKADAEENQAQRARVCEAAYKLDRSNLRAKKCAESARKNLEFGK